MEFIDHQPSTEMCFIVIGSVKRAERISQYRVSRLATVAMQREGKRRTVACMKAISYS